MKKTILYTALAGSAALASLNAGEIMETVELKPAAGFESVRRPISNPTLFDSALPSTNVHGIYMHQRHPDSLNLAGGGSVPVSGDFNLYALQFEIALNERTSIVATKDGYIDFNPDTTLSQESGFANLAAGVKHAFYINEAKQEAASVSIVAELPTGNRDVWQGNGDGAINLNLNGLKLINDWQFAGSLGFHLPIDSDEESTTSFLSAHLGYNVTDKFYLLAEANWFRVLSAGDGNPNFGAQLGGAVPGAVAFEGGDLINLGSANATLNKDIVTAAIGCRYMINAKSDIGFAYEIPLTEDSDSLMKDRITLDFVYKF